MYKLTIRTSFAAAHNLMNYQGDCENLHGHNWKVDLTVTAKELDKAGLGIDFKVLKREAGVVIQELDHKYLNDNPAFSQISPSSEHIARYLYQRIGERLNNDVIKVESVAVWESDNELPAIMSDPVYISEIFSSIQGEGLLAGRRQLFIRLAECNLDCSYCDTDHARTVTCRIETAPGSAAFTGVPQPLGLQYVHDLVMEWCRLLPGAHHSISVTGGEPLLYAESLGEWFSRLRTLLPIHLETNGTMHIALELVVKHVDYVSMDMKLPSTSGCTEHLWGLHGDFLRVADGRNASVKVVVGNESGLDEIRQVCDIITDVNPATPLFLQPLSGSDGKIGISVAHLLRLQEAASARLPDVRVIPQMHLMLGAL